MNTLLFERFTTVAPLGLRFWDGVTNSWVSGGLQVFAAPKGNLAHRLAATVSSHGIYGFAHLPGLRDLENGAGDVSDWDQLPATAKRDFLITVTDPEGRFQALTLNVTAPVRGIYTLTCPAATPATDWPNATVPLFSAATRSVPAGMAVVRREVRTTDNQPAAWAVLEARWGNTVIARGLADARGQVTLIFPYPRPAITDTTPLLKQSWEIQLRMYYAPAISRAIIPELCTVLQQPLITTPLPNTPVTVTFR